mgnify:CR=1 FL=1
MTKDGLPGEASQEGQSRPVSLAGLVLVLCVALMGVMGVSITLPILPKLGAVFHQDAAGVALLITCFTLPSAFMTPVAGVLADRFGRKAVLLPGLLLFACGGMGCAFSDSFENLLATPCPPGCRAAPQTVPPAAPRPAICPRAAPAAGWPRGTPVPPRQVQRCSGAQNSAPAHPTPGQVEIPALCLPAGRSVRSRTQPAAPLFLPFAPWPALPAVRFSAPILS